MLQVTSRGSLNSSFGFLRLYLQRIRKGEWDEQNMPESSREERNQMIRGYDKALNDMQYGVRRITGWLYYVPKGIDLQGRHVSLKNVIEFINESTTHRK